MSAVLTISLDFELHWGVRDKVSTEQYRRHLLGAREVVPILLDLFRELKIGATWATVGMLFFGNRADLLANLPALRPEYTQTRLSPYGDLDAIGDGERDDPFHYAASLVRRILDTPGQELASHTFSHYYCLERGQGEAAFREDLLAARHAAGRLGVEMKSLVLPRNQRNPAYDRACTDAGFRILRGNQHSWLHAPRNEEQESLLRRSLRVADAFVNLSGHHAGLPTGDALLDIPASRFLRPWTPGFRHLEPLRLRRLSRELKEAAARGTVYHLWWHPHNFGAHPRENMAALRRFLLEFKALEERGLMVSRTMGGVLEGRPAESGTP